MSERDGGGRSERLVSLGRSLSAAPNGLIKTTLACGAAHLLDVSARLRAARVISAENS